MNVVKPETINTTGTITRASTGTYFDSSGVMQTAAIDVIRADHDASTGEFQGVLIENAKTNALLQSQTFESTTWIKSGATVQSNVATAPDGTLTADKLAEGTTNAFHNIFQVAGTVGNLETLSIFAQASGRDSLVLGLGSSFGSFNLLLGICSGTGATIKPIKNGWYRCILTATRSDTSNYIYSSLNGSTFFLGGGSSIGVNIWGAQLESGTVTSYIPTVATTASRAADIVTGSGLIYTNLSNTDAEWSSATTYALGQKVSYGFYVYTSLQNSNTNQNPATATAYWVKTSPTNKTAMFDTQVATTAISSTSIIFAVRVNSVDTVSLLNIVGAKAEVTLTDYETHTSLYHASNNLQGSSVTSWWDYFDYNSGADRTQAMFLNLPSSGDAIISVKIVGTGDVRLGSFINGVLENLGASQYGATAGIIDYSRKVTDDFGNTSFVIRNFSKRLSAKISLSNPNLNRVQRLLYNLRATPALWITTTDTTYEEPLIVYGFYKDFSTEIAYPSHALCNLEIEGLV